MWVGVAAAVVLCVGVGDRAADRSTSSCRSASRRAWRRSSALIAVGMVTFMIFWMRRHARELEGELRASAAGALARGLGLGARRDGVLRRPPRGPRDLGVPARRVPGVAATRPPPGIGAAARRPASRSRSAGASTAAACGSTCARFFRVTGVASCSSPPGSSCRRCHTAHEAAWFNSLQDRRSTSAGSSGRERSTSSLLTGRARAAAPADGGEVVGWLLYAVPMLAYRAVARGGGSAPRAAAPVRAPAQRALRRLWARATWSRLRRGRAARSPRLRSAARRHASGTATTARPSTVTLTDDGCSPAKLAAPGAGRPRSRSRRRHAEGDRARAQEPGRDHPRRAREHRLRDQRLVHAQPQAGALRPQLPERRRRGQRRPRRDAASGSRRGLGATRSSHAARHRLPRLRRAAGRRAARAARSSSLRRSRAGDLAKAKELFGPTRYHYETIEPVAESFGNLDPEIDARVNDVAKADRVDRLPPDRADPLDQGHDRRHRPYADKLLADVTSSTARSKTSTFQPAQLANGAVELLNEVASSKITGEEDRYSHTDLSDFAGQCRGSTQGVRARFGPRWSARIDGGSPRRSPRGSPPSTAGSTNTAARRARLRPLQRADAGGPARVRAAGRRARRAALDRGGKGRAADADGRSGSRVSRAVRSPLPAAARSASRAGGVGGYVARRDEDELVDGRASRSTAGTRPGSPPPRRTGCRSAPSTSRRRAGRELAELLRDWTRGRGAMTAGEPVGAPTTTCARAARRHRRGARAAGVPAHGDLRLRDRRSSSGRFGLARRRPAALVALPAFPGDTLDPARSGGDLCVQACADDPQVAFHAVRNLARIALGRAALRWTQLGFGRTSSPRAARKRRATCRGSRTGPTTCAVTTRRHEPVRLGRRRRAPDLDARRHATSSPAGSGC